MMIYLCNNADLALKSSVSLRESSEFFEKLRKSLTVLRKIFGKFLRYLQKSSEIANILVGVVYISEVTDTLNCKPIVWFCPIIVLKQQPLTRIGFFHHNLQ